jgi:DNA-binding MarR family transcriptional regulator
MNTSLPNPEISQIRAAARRLVRELGFMRPTLAGTDLPPSAVHALIEIGMRPSMTAVELCEILVLEKSSVSRMLRKLIESGELVENRSGADERAKLLSLTAQGRATLKRIDAFAHRQVAAALERLEPKTRRVLAETLAAYAHALEESRIADTESPVGGAP